MAGQVHHLAAGGIEGVMKFGRERRQRVASVMGGRRARVEFGMSQVGVSGGRRHDRAAGAAGAVPEVRIEALENGR